MFNDKIVTTNWMEYKGFQAKDYCIESFGIEICKNSFVVIEQHRTFPFFINRWCYEHAMVIVYNKNIFWFSEHFENYTCHIFICSTQH